MQTGPQSVANDARSSRDLGREPTNSISGSQDSESSSAHRHQHLQIAQQLERATHDSTSSLIPGSAMDNTDHGAMALATSPTSPARSPAGTARKAISRRPSLLTRLHLSVSTTSTLTHDNHEALYSPADFQVASEHPEKHFIDSIGMMIPGACDRDQCAYARPHFITAWQLSKPHEYTTSLADHGIAYTDHERLIAVLSQFLEVCSSTPKFESTLHPQHRWSRSAQPEQGDPGSSNATKSENGKFAAKAAARGIQYETIEEQSQALLELLAAISNHWRSRCLPVMICVSSFALFAPNCITDAQIQILHIPEHARVPSVNAPKSRTAARLSFIEPSAVAQSDGHFGARTYSCSSSHAASSPLITPTDPSSTFHHPRQLLPRDRSRPWSVWPNAIPSRKRELVNEHSDRYGADPYFRVWMQEYVNSRTHTASYAKWLTERDGDPFANKPKEYVNTRNGARSWGCLKTESASREPRNTNSLNRSIYYHNRSLECRHAVEQGTRLRLARFGFWQPIIPPHTPEMEELGLTSDLYATIVRHIDLIREHTQTTNSACWPIPLQDCSMFRARRTHEAIHRVSEYIRELNAADRRIVWTLQKIPHVCDRGTMRNEVEWEISAWNGEDPLGLLMQLEKWGIIEDRLNFEDEEA